MFQEKNDTASTATAKQPEKSSKEKTLATAHQNNQGQVDLTKELSIVDVAYITQNDHIDVTSTGVYTDSIADYSPGKYLEHAVVAEPPKKEEEKPKHVIGDAAKDKEFKEKIVEEKEDEYILVSYVGEYTTNKSKGIIANLAKDVAIVQEKLLELGILSQDDYDTEKPTSINGEIGKEITKTIHAIKYFQKVVMGQSEPTGYLEPSDAAHIQLVDITSDEFKREKSVYKEKKAEEERIQQIKDTPFDIESVLTKLKTIEEENLDVFLKDYVSYNLDFIIQLIDSTESEEKYYYVTHVIDALSNTELDKLPEALNHKFYDIVSSQEDFEGNIKYMARLINGRKAFGLDEDYLTKEDEKRDKEKEKEQKKKAKIGLLTGKVGLVKTPDKKTNLPKNIRYIQKLLNNITDKSTRKKYLEKSAFFSEDPFLTQEELRLKISSSIDNKSIMPSFDTQEVRYYFLNDGSFDEKYSDTYKAIIKFQKDHYLKVDGEIWPGYSAIEKLVATSNQETKNKDKEVKKKQDAKQDAKQESKKDTKKTLTGKVGLVKTPDKNTNLPKNIRYVQKLLNNITDKATGKKYLENAAFFYEDPFLTQEELSLKIDSQINNRSKEPSFDTQGVRYYLLNDGSFDQKYSETYKAIIKFQTDYRLKIDGEIWPKYNAIEKLVAASNQETKNEDKEVKKKQNAKQEFKKDTKKTLTGKVGLVKTPDKNTNLPKNIRYVQKLLNNITDKATGNKYLENSAFFYEDPFLTQEELSLKIDSKINNRSKRPSFDTQEVRYYLLNDGNFDQKYSDTYKAIIKFQTDHYLLVDGEIWRNGKAIEKLVAVSNQETKNKEKEAEKKQNDKKDPAKDTKEVLTGTIGLVKDNSTKPWNDPIEIAFVQKLLNNITYIDGTDVKKYLENGAFINENPFIIELSWMTNSKPEESYSIMLEKPKSFNQEYPNTYNAIIKFQEDHCSFKADGVVGSGKDTIEKLVALSNQATKNREIEAIAKQEAEKLDKRIKQAMNRYSEDKYTSLLKSHLLEEPKYVSRFITLLGEEKSKNVSYQLVKDLMDKTSDRDLVRIDTGLDEILFGTLYDNGTIKKDINYLLRLRTGKNKYEVDGKFTTIESLISLDDWRHQGTSGEFSDSEGGGTRCKRVSEKMIYRALYKDLDEKFLRSEVLSNPNYKHKLGVTDNKSDQFLSIIKEDKSEYKNIEEGVRKQSTFYKVETFKKGMDYINRYLEEGIPVLAGVDHTFNRNLNVKGKTTSKKGYGYNEGTTDHFVVIVGRGYTEDGKRYYQFYDPGTTRSLYATDEKCKLIENEDGYFVGSHTYSGNPYYLSMVVLFTKDFKQYANEIAQNTLDEKKLISDVENKENYFAK